MDYRIAGKRKTLSFGKYQIIGLKEARERRDAAKRLLASGIDPSREKKEARTAVLAIEKERATTFEAVAREWFAKKIGLGSLSSKKNIITLGESE